MLVLLAKVRSIKVEPYWNVNVSSNTFPILIAKIKVEPYWNVNLVLAL